MSILSQADGLCDVGGSIPSVTGLNRPSPRKEDCLLPNDLSWTIVSCLGPKASACLGLQPMSI